jgi:hypothetical protein
MALKLPRLPANWQSQPQLLETYWDRVMTQIETILNQLLTIPVIQDALADVTAATVAANTAAAAAQSAADDVTNETSIVNSYPAGYIGDLISSTAVGVVTIAAHNRVYGDGTSVAVDPNVIVTGTAPGDVVRVYYDDPTRAGGAVSYLFTVDPATAPVQGGARHSVGVVTVPAVGTASGNNLRAPGYVEP